MKERYLILGLASTLAVSQVQAQNVAEKALAPKMVKVNGAHATALKYLDSDGEYFSLNQVEGEMKLVKDIVQAIDDMLENERGTLPPGLTLTDLVKKAKLTEIKKLGSSSKKIKGGWLNKSFIDVNGSKDGLWSLLRGKGGEWGAYAFAPSETDFMMEIDINIESMYKVLEIALENVEAKAAESIKKGAITGFESHPVASWIAKGLHFRTSVVAEFKKSGVLKLGKGNEIPAIQFAFRTEGLYPLFQLLEDELLNTLDKKVVEGLIVYSQKKENLKEERKFDPMLVMDPKTKVVWTVSDLAYLKKCRGNGPKLKDSKEFAEVKKALPKGGNLLCYMSNELIGVVADRLDGQLANGVESWIQDIYWNREEEKMALKAFEIFRNNVVPEMKKAENGYAYALDLNEDGLHACSLSPVPVKDPLVHVVSGTLPAAVPFAAPIIIRQGIRARATMAINNAKDIYIAVSSYSSNNGGDAPTKKGEKLTANEHLRLLFSSGACRDEKPFYVQGMAGFVEGDDDYSGNNALAPGENVWGYVPGRSITNDPANTPLVMAPLKKGEDGKWNVDMNAFGGQMVILRIDGSAVIYSVEERDGGFYSTRTNKLLYKEGFAFLHRDKVSKFKVTMPEPLPKKK